MSIENYISVRETEGPKFVVALEQHVKNYEVDIMDVQRAEKLVSGRINEIHLASGAVLKAKTVVISTGARWREIGVPGEREYRNRGVAYCPHCDGPLFKDKRVAVVGGGNSGVEAAIDLAGLVSAVTLIEFGAELRADAVLQKKLRSLPNVTVVTSAQTTEITGDGKKVGGINYTDRTTGAAHRVELEGVFVQIGLVPNTEWLKGTIKLSKHGEIVVDAKGATSVPGVFAAGDVTTVPYKQIVIAGRRRREGIALRVRSSDPRIGGRRSSGRRRHDGVSVFKRRHVDRRRTRQPVRLFLFRRSPRPPPVSVR